LFRPRGCCWPDLDEFDVTFTTDTDAAAAAAQAVLAKYEDRLDAEARAELSAAHVLTIDVEAAQRV